MLGNTKNSNDEQWMAIESKFGLLLSGPIPKLNEENTVSQVIDAQQTGEDNLNEILSKFWELGK